MSNIIPVYKRFLWTAIIFILVLAQCLPEPVAAAGYADIVDRHAVVQKRIILHEGYKLEAYADNLGKWTIGVGRLLNRNKHWRGYTVDPDTAYEWFIMDYSIAHRDARFLVPNFDKLTFDRRGVLIEMSFVFGYNKLREFQNMLRCVARYAFSCASDEILNSLWARNQAPTRATYLAKIMRGELGQEQHERTRETTKSVVESTVTDS